MPCVPLQELLACVLQAYDREGHEKGGNVVPRGDSGEEERQEFEETFDAIVDAHERAVGNYNDAPDLPSAVVIAIPIAFAPKKYLFVE